MSAVIGKYREVNIACGRNLAFFVETLLEKRRAGGRPRDMTDEELVAYVSGDVQGTTDNGWVWQGSETGMALNQQPAGGFAGEERHREYNGPMKATLSDNEMNDWGGWERVEYLVGLLMRNGDEERERERYPQPPRPIGAYGQPQQQPPPPAPLPRMDEREVQRTTKDRISIANII